jgi:hypothetical protein
VNSHEENHLESFSLYGNIFEVWKMGWTLELGGSSSLTINVVSLVLRILNGLSNLGMNFASQHSPVNLNSCHL